MRRSMLSTVTLIATLTGVAGCATNQEMAIWRAHGTHFASGGHGVFSIRSDISSQPRVTRADLSRASAEAWWGDPVTISADQIVDR